MNNTVFWKTVRKHKDVKLLTIEVTMKYLVPKPNYETTKNYWDHLLAIETKIIQLLMNKPVYLGLPIV